MVVVPTAKDPHEAILELPDNVVGQIIDGELHVSPRPAVRHSQAASAAMGALYGSFNSRGGDPGGWLILFEPEIELGRDVLVPDLAGWRRTRLPELPDVARMSLAPDWICEVLSPSTSRVDRAKKLPIYARHGVGHAWLVDPRDESLEAYRLESGRWMLLGVHGGADRARIEPFDAIELDVARLWER